MLKQKIKIGSRQIGEGKPTFIIAEIGSNHDGSLEQAKKLIDVAVEAWPPKRIENKLIPANRPAVVANVTYLSRIYH